MDAISRIVALESGELTYEEGVELFQELVSTGLINQLQGSYQRTAARLIDDGEISL